MRACTGRRASAGGMDSRDSPGPKRSRDAGKDEDGGVPVCRALCAEAPAAKSPRPGGGRGPDRAREAVRPGQHSGLFAPCAAQYDLTGNVRDGLTVPARDKASGSEVIIRLVTNAVEDAAVGRRLLRELKLLRHFRGHDNIERVHDILAVHILKSSLYSGCISSCSRALTWQNLEF